MPKKQRDYKKEYQARRRRAELQGLSVSQARGHARKTELSIRDIKQARSKKKGNWLLNEVYKSNDPRNIELYNQAKKEGWAKRKTTQEPRTAKDKLIRRLNQDRDSDFADETDDNRES